MFDDPTETAEDKMSDAIGCVIVSVAGAVLLLLAGVGMLLWWRP